MDSFGVGESVPSSSSVIDHVTAFSSRKVFGDGAND